MGRALLDLTGQCFGKWTVVGRAPRNNKNLTQWFCECECGTRAIVRTASLRRGDSKSCGCSRFLESVKSDHPLYKQWQGVISRCSPNGEYGRQGIFVCDRWKTFELFVDDMYQSWEKGLTIERIDNDKGYGPDNCRWIPVQEQPLNRSCDKDIIVTMPDGSETIVPGGFISRFCREQGFDIRKMNDVLKGRRSHYKGYTAKYADFKIPAWMRPFA